MTNNQFLLRGMNVHLEYRLQSYRVYQLPRFGWKNFEVNRRMSPDSGTFFIIFLFYPYDFVVGLKNLRFPQCL